MDNEKCGFWDFHDSKLYHSLYVLAQATPGRYQNDELFCRSLSEILEHYQNDEL